MNLVSQTTTRVRWAIGINGALSALFGVMTLAWPGISLYALTILFGAYIRFVASYQTIFGNLATVVILCGYIYLSSIVFFAGAQVDSIIRRRVEGNPQGR